MQNLLIEIKEHLLQNRTCVLIENGTWAPSAKKTMKAILEPLSWNYIAPVRKWRCKICGYEYSGEELPENFICPLCKHPASDFEEITE